MRNRAEIEAEYERLRQMAAESRTLEEDAQIATAIILLSWILWPGVHQEPLSARLEALRRTVDVSEVRKEH